MRRANRHRGEIEAEFDGKTHVLCLTLGALAELEAAYGGEDLISIAERFEKGRLSATDAIRVLGAGLRGGGTAVTNEELARMAVKGGVAGSFAIVAELLQATFLPEELPTPGKPQAPPGRDFPGGA